MRKVLVVTPTWIKEDGSKAIHPECEASVMANLRAFDGEADWIVPTDNPHPLGHKNVLHQYQRAQEHFLSGDWDAFVTIEHDNVLPDESALQRMYDTEGDVIYAPYLLRHGTFVLNTWQYINDRNLGMSLSNYPDELRAAREARVWRICGCGMGFTLFRRHTMERLRFRGGDGDQLAPDIPFAEDAIRAGFVSIGRFDVPVAHWEGDVRLEPYRGATDMKFVATQTVNAMADGEYVSLVAGREYLLKPMVASDLVRAGYIEPVADATHTSRVTAQAEYAAHDSGEIAMMARPKSKRVK